MQCSLHFYPLGIINGGVITPTPTTTTPALTTERPQPLGREPEGAEGGSAPPEEEEVAPLSPPQYMNSAALRKDIKINKYETPPRL